MSIKKARPTYEAILRDPRLLEDLSPDVLTNLAMNYLGIKDIINLCKTSRALKELCREENYPLWNNVFMRSFPYENSTLLDYVKMITTQEFNPMWGDLDVALRYFMKIPKLMNRAKTWTVATAAARNLFYYGYETVIFNNGIIFEVETTTEYIYSNTTENPLKMDFDNSVNILTIIFAYYMYRGLYITTEVITLRCMICSNIALFKEETNEENIFCGESCQREFYKD